MRVPPGPKRVKNDVKNVKFMENFEHIRIDQNDHRWFQGASERGSERQRLWKDTPAWEIWNVSKQVERFHFTSKIRWNVVWDFFLRQAPQAEKIIKKVRRANISGSAKAAQKQRYLLSSVRFKRVRVDFLILLGKLRTCGVAKQVATQNRNVSLRKMFFSWNFQS